MKKILILLFISYWFAGCEQLGQVVNTTGAGTGPGLTNEEVIRGLKEALTVGTNSSSAKAGQTDGFYRNARLFIPWPPEARQMKERLLALGFEAQVNRFEESLNRAAEEAAKQAAPVFADAITKMTVSDGFAILRGSDTSATAYLRKTTYVPLKDKFKPVVKEATQKVEVTRYWSPLVTAYNRIPGVKQQDPDLDNYVTDKTIGGLMLLIADEEIKIRRDPAARVTELLKKVFGS